MGARLPPPPPQEPRADMVAHQHPHPHPHPHPQYQQPPPQQQYRLPGPNEWTQAPPPHADPYRQAQPPPQYVQQHHQPPAPRQRTAIACRYCRRRKIRCSGFEATEDGRCSNCMRFNQDCIFTPVSAQTQAFVPAHTVWRGVGQPPPMYGAYGQPLPPANQAEPYGRPQQYLPSPTAGPYPAYPVHASPGASPVETTRDDLNGRKRPHAEPHTPTLPPPTPGAASQAPHRGTRQEYAFPEPSSLTSVAPTAGPPAPYPAAPQTAAQPYYAAQPPRQASPQSAYRYDASRASSSPHSQAPTTPGAAPSPYYTAPAQPNGALQPLPPRSEGRTPPPPTSQAAPTRPGMRINDLVTDNGPGRSSTDSSMLNMLNRRPM
ncbi:hypothetical protein P153DRAFT_205772 [Dothidotthia symphoricarpi CBS 119687]|uniref:Zn(2)-C6 fungal-type domain-containing protein n=1 Tax=Dothidotthia symphoricarpi CBS 119687 TaxID=1392245 RepID=A0A6A6AK77_9PLEO|nr:uncharacterized protein P153DRAFT_205772 [Dothidotthia symphoricarpi CBS 119687]KAF2130841.1 hypothetical protein P153DRAFT_205772 [Dothidotthia symphoricarpi CBS 119687]